MKYVYFDASSGVSGDMILGALVDLGLQPKVLTSHLSKLSLGGYRIEVSREQRGPIAGTKVNVKVENEVQPPRSARDVENRSSRSSAPTVLSIEAISSLV